MQEITKKKEKPKKLTAVHRRGSETNDRNKVNRMQKIERDRHVRGKVHAAGK